MIGLLTAFPVAALTQSRTLFELGLVVVLAAVTGVLIYQGNQTQTASSLPIPGSGSGSSSECRIGIQ